MSRATTLLALALALAPTAVTADPAATTLPLDLDERPFLLVDAPRRYLPGEAAFVRVQKAHGGPVQLGVFRLHALASFVTSPLDRQGVSIAATPVGAEAESLLVRGGALPRRGGLVDLVSLQRVVLQARPQVRRAVGNEAAVYDSNETDEGAAETWGVNAGDWADERVPLGALPAGVYLVRAHAGGWAATAIVSVSGLTVLARRGDARDRVVVTDGEGVPQANVTVQRFVNGAAVESARTDAQGAVEMPARDDHELRYVAVRGDDVAWADASHVRADACDVRVYMGVGRPAFRPGEAVNVRGHARGCVDGRDAPLGDEPVELRTGDEGAPRVTARTDADGNFVAELPAASELIARVRGRDHRRTLHLDARPLPRRALRLRLDRTWAAAGEAVTVSAADEQGAWPEDATVTFRTPGGEGRSRIGPGHPASFTFVMPATDDPLARRRVRAEVRLRDAVTYAEGELWTGAWPDLIELTSDETRGEPGRDVSVSLSVKDLGGRPHAGAVTVRVFGSDGNRAVGAARWSRDLRLGEAGSRERVTLAGEGPWWIEAAPSGDVRASKASLVVWERERPASLSGRGALAVQPSAGVAAPGHPLALTLRAPAVGSTLLTLEQGGVWASRHAGGGGVFELPVPEGARGLATVVATHVHAGEVSYASAAVEVETSRRFGLRVSTDRRAYGAGANARVTVAARNDDGAPRDAVVSLWVADAGWWEIADEDHPSPDAFFRLPGRRASAGDSAHPRGYGAEEGRRLDTALEWNGRRLPGTTFRHAWGHATELSRFEMVGTFGDIARRLAQDAGLAGAVVCSETERSLGRVHAKVTAVPWDMAAVRIATATETTATVSGRVLHFDCGASLGAQRMGTTGHGSGSGSGSGHGALGRARSQTLDGTVFFLGTRRLGPTGTATLDVPLPDHPGRWRVEALAIADDGAGTSAHAVATTSLPVEARVELPTTLAVGDEARGSLSVESTVLASREASFEVTTSRGLSLTTPASARVTVDAQGRATVPVALRASEPGDQTVTLSVTSTADPRVTDRVELAVRVRNDPARQPVHVDAPVGPDASEVELRVPPLTAPASLTVRVGGGVEQGATAVLDALREPRWNLPSLRLDRVMSLLALREALAHAPSAALLDEVRRSLSGETAALREHLRAAGGVSWWRRMRPSPWLTSELLWAVGPDLEAAERADAVAVVTAAARDPLASLPVAARAAAALARVDASSALVGPLVDRVVSGRGDLDALTWALRAARLARDDRRSREIGAALAAALDRTVANHPQSPCAGVHWLLCMESYGDRALVARAARELVRLDAAHEPIAARALAWIVRNPTVSPGPRWGTVEGEVVALQAALPAGASTSEASVRFGGRELARVRPGASATVTVPGDGVLSVVFEREERRATRAVIEGELGAVAPTTSVGPGALATRVETNAGAAELVAEFTLPAAARDVELGVPLPAAYAPAFRSGANDLVRAAGGRRADRWGFDLASWDFYALDRAPAPSRPRVEATDGGVRVRYGSLPAGRHTLRLPLTAAAQGRFHAGSAWMRADGGRVWSVAPAMEVESR